MKTQKLKERKKTIEDLKVKTKSIKKSKTDEKNLKMKTLGTLKQRDLHQPNITHRSKNLRH
jgi:pimeloyl-CoA synthetase